MRANHTQHAKRVAVAMAPPRDLAQEVQEYRASLSKQTPHPVCDVFYEHNRPHQLLNC